MSLITRAAKGAPLTHAELDGNFAHLQAAIDGMAASAGVSVASVTESGGVMTVWGTDGTALGHVVLPVGSLTHRGEYAVGVTYAAGSVVTYRGAVFGVPAEVTSAAFWSDYDAGALVPLFGLGGPSRSSVTAGVGPVVFEVPARLSLAAGMAVRVSSADDTLVLEGTVTAYAGTSLTVEVSVVQGAGTSDDWIVEYVGGGLGAGRGWINEKTLSADAVATTADAGLLLAADTSVTLPAAGSVATGTRFVVTGWGVDVLETGVESGPVWRIDGGEIVTFTASASGYGVSRARNLSAGAYAYEFKADKAFVFGDAGLLADHQYYGSGWDPMYGQETLEAVVPGVGDPHLVRTWVSGAEYVSHGQGIVDASVGYQVGGSALSLSHLAAGIPTLDSYAVATLPVAADHAGGLVHVSDGDAGAACLAYSDGTDWLRVALGTAVSAT